MPIFFDENALTPEQRARYDWAVAEYERVQDENRVRLQRAGKTTFAHQISPKSALFARLLEGKEPLPFPPPTSYSYPWYDIIEKPGKYQVSIGGCVQAEDLANCDGVDEAAEHIVLNQCPWRILDKNQGGAWFQSFLQQTHGAAAIEPEAHRLLEDALAGKPAFGVSYGQWGEFRLALGRIIRRGRRAVAANCRFDLQTLDGGNPVIVKVLRSGAELRAKADATLANLRSKQSQEQQNLSVFDQITLASESAIPRSDSPEDDDLVEYDCDGWVLEKS